MAMLISLVSFAEEATLSFADKAQRTSFSSTQQVWEQDGITFTNDKAKSSNAVADYANPVRLYQGSTITVECGKGNITKIVFATSESKYVTPLQNSLGTSLGAVATSGTNVTLTLSTPAASINAIALTAQVRLKTITVTYEKVQSTEPTITCGNVSFGIVKAGATSTKELVVEAENLTEAITATFETGTAFSVTGDLTTTGGTLTLAVIATEEGTYNDVLTLTSGTATKTVEVSANVITCQGEGTEEKPYLIADVIKLANSGEVAWVEGYIIGVMNNNELVTSNIETNSNIVIASTAEDTVTYVPVAIPTEIRKDVNLVDNPTNIGKKIAVKGKLDAYFSMPGVRETSEYKWAVTKYTVTATAENGTVEGAGEYEEGKEATLTATANEGYEFVNWTVDGAEVSTENPYTFVVTANVALVANFKAVVIEEPLPEGVPTNAELWEAFKPYYNTYYSLTRDLSHPVANVSTFANAKMQEIMTDAASEYKWLGDYVLSVATAAGVTLSTDMASANEGGWRWAVHAFFNAAEGQHGATGINFTEAGKPQAWGPYYLAAQQKPEEPVMETVYFVNAANWTKVNAYAWDPVQNANWPGKAATKEAEQIAGYDVYSYTAEAGTYANVIFNNGSGQQTADLKWTAGKYYVKDGWYTKEEAEAALAKPVEYESVYFVDNQGWGKANIYTWTPEVGTWPGVAMKKEAEQLAGYDVYSYTVEKGTSFGGVIFNNGSKQTGDLKWTAGKYYVKDGWYTKEEAEAKLAGPVTPPVITYVLMGVKGDWTTGIALTQNPDNANEYVLLGQEILEGDAVKVVTLTDGVATAWCGNVDEYSVERTFDDMGNIVLAPGKYDFYFKVKEDLIYIGAVKPEVITYELNGGEFPAVVVPTNAELWEAFKPYYNTYYGLARADQPIDKVSTFASAKMQEIMTDEASEYKWLGDYVQSVATAAGVPLSTDMASANESGWRWAVHAFFNAAAGQYGAAGIDFTEAGKPENWGAAYEAEYGVVLPTEPVAEDYVLPTPTKEGYIFVGWYDNAEGTGEPYKVIPAGWAGTLYAIWKQDTTTALDNIAVEGKAVKAIINGQLIIIKNGVQYNAQGVILK